MNNKLTMIEHLKDCAEAAKTFTNALVGKFSEATVNALEEMGQLKQDKSKAITLVISEDGWMTDKKEPYPNYYDVVVDGITEHDRAVITIATGSLDTAKICGLCPTNETIAGKIRIRSTSIPKGEIAAEYWIENGREK